MNEFALLLSMMREPKQYRPVAPAAGMIAESVNIKTTNGQTKTTFSQKETRELQEACERFTVKTTGHMIKDKETGLYIPETR